MRERLVGLAASVVWVGCSSPAPEISASASGPASASASAPAPASASASAPAPASPSASAPSAQRPADGAIAELAIDGDLPAYVIHPAAGAPPLRTVFLAGSCSHPLDMIKSFQAAAAKHGGLVALQGDVPCKGKDGRLRKWSSDSVATQARIEAALAAAGGATTDLTLMGYSQGAERAEWIGHRFPAKYTHFVLMAGPGIPVASRLDGARSVVTTAGHGDVRENMAIGAKRLKHAKIPAIYMEIPTLTHGELAPGADAVVAQAFDWLDTHSRTDPHPRREAKRR